MRTCCPRVVVCLALALGLATAAMSAQEPDLSSAPRITVAELKQLQASGDVVVVDVRDKDSFREGHIPGSRSIPLEQIESRAEELKAAKKTIVTYCN